MGSAPLLLGCLPPPPSSHVQVDPDARGNGHEETHHDEPALLLLLLLLLVVGRLHSPDRRRSTRRRASPACSAAHMHHAPARATPSRRGGLRLEGRVAPWAVNGRHGFSIAPPSHGAGGGSAPLDSFTSVVSACLFVCLSAPSVVRPLCAIPAPGVHALVLAPVVAPNEQGPNEQVGHRVTPGNPPAEGEGKHANEAEHHDQPHHADRQLDHCCAESRDQRARAPWRHSGPRGVARSGSVIVGGRPVDGMADRSPPPLDPTARLYQRGVTKRGASADTSPLRARWPTTAVPAPGQIFGSPRRPTARAPTTSRRGARRCPCGSSRRSPSSSWLPP